MRRIVLGFVFVGSIIITSLTGIAGCSADGTSEEPDDAAKNDPKKTTPSKTADDSSKSKQDDGHYTMPGTPSEDPKPSEPTTPTPAPEDPPPPPATPDPPTQPPAGSPTGSQTLSCTSETGGNKSVSTFVFVLDNGTVKFSKLSVAMTNKENRDKNDIDVFVTLSGTTVELKSFNSDDILPNAKTTEVPLPNNFAPPVGSKIRIETNFDKAFADPSASCIIQF